MERSSEKYKMQERLNVILDRFSNVRILCVGDIMLDRFIQGKVERISPEAPVPVFQFVQEKQMLGGAGNVVANLHALGCKTFFVGMVGKDECGSEIGSLLKSLDSDFYLQESDLRPTIIKTRFIAGNNHILRFDKEKNVPLTFDEEQNLLSELQGEIKKADIVLLSDYAKGVLSEAVIKGIINACQKEGRKTLIDPKGADYSKYAGAFLIKPNRKELELASGCVLDSSADDFLKKVSDAAYQVLNKFSIQNMIVTLSEKGMLYVPQDPSKEQIYLSTYAREVFDVSGAGDTSLATLGAALAAGADIRDAMELANTASGIVVGKLGTATVSVDELKNK